LLTSMSPPTVDLAALSERLKVLAEPKRLLILHTLMQGVQCNCELSDMLGMAPNLISHHMNVLCQAGLVTAERDPLDARWIYYSVNSAAVEALAADFSSFLDTTHIQPRQSCCGPVKNLKQLVDPVVTE
jgi:ArsR family transcriptional regulator